MRVLVQTAENLLSEIDVPKGYRMTYEPRSGENGLKWTHTSHRVALRHVKTHKDKAFRFDWAKDNDGDISQFKQVLMDTICRAEVWAGKDLAGPD